MKWKILLTALAILATSPINAGDCPSPPMSGVRDYVLLSFVDQENPDLPGFKIILKTTFRVRNDKVHFEPYNHNLPIVGQQWWLGDQLLRSCGDTNRAMTLFWDGFETGTTSRWSQTQPQP